MHLSETSPAFCCSARFCVLGKQNRTRYAPILPERGQVLCRALRQRFPWSGRRLSVRVRRKRLRRRNGKTRFQRRPKDVLDCRRPQFDDTYQFRTAPGSAQYTARWCSGSAPSAARSRHKSVQRSCRFKTPLFFTMYSTADAIERISATYTRISTRICRYGFRYRNGNSS